MARVIRASGERNPDAIRVIRQTLVLDSGDRADRGVDRVDAPVGPFVLDRGKGSRRGVVHDAPLQVDEGRDPSAPSADCLAGDCRGFGFRWARLVTGFVQTGLCRCLPLLLWHAIGHHVRRRYR